jgi:hypothetical protein
MNSRFWKLPRDVRDVYLRAVDEGVAHAETWMAEHAKERLTRWEELAASVGQGTTLLTKSQGSVELAARWLGVKEPLNEAGLLTQLAMDALTWYDRAFRGRIDEALDPEDSP